MTPPVMTPGVAPRCEQSDVALSGADGVHTHEHRFFERFSDQVITHGKR